ncbi:MAG: NADH-quinone oxidoreductase subunit L [Desulfobacteraceae bacterium]|nr:NADH-quinone oxidoreductase subunit L [Desulfobacteraceae bacterium]
MFENLITTLTFCPLVAALACYFLRGERLRSALVIVTGIVLILSAVLLIGSAPVSMTPALFTSVKFKTFIQSADFLLLGLILYFGIKFKNRIIIGLSLLQVIILGYFEFFMTAGTHEAPVGIFCDHLSLIMVLIISIAGSLIVLYALPYMKNHEKHLKLKKSRQPRFFALLFLFIGAMNAMVLVNDMMLFYFFFEITTLCSFLLIGHDKTEESKRNSLTALWINSLGGATLLIGIVLIYTQLHTLDIQSIISQVQGKDILLIPLALLCIAGFTKAAQMPFQKWLLGAMVAPTPTSALLHSSTMVKAGVYLLIRFAPAFAGTSLSTLVAVCGAFTFLSAAALAIGQSNGKKVLAYSTISNLGLIIACVGINTHASLTAAIILLIFHAVSKALLFLCMGSIEQHIGSRDIEDMRGLFGEMPITALVITLGILTMILPPFGMLIGKWMAIESASGNLLVILMLALGSALTVVYWARWAGILMGSDFSGKSTPEKMPLFSKIPLFTLLSSAILLGFLTPIIYSSMILPDFSGLVAAPFSIHNGIIFNNQGSFAVYPLFFIAIVVFLFALFLSRPKKAAQQVSPYMSGIQGKQPGSFVGPMNKVTTYTQSNYYLSAFFGEEKLSNLVNMTAGILILILIGVSF